MVPRSCCSDTALELAFVLAARPFWGSWLKLGTVSRVNPASELPWWWGESVETRPCLGSADPEFDMLRFSPPQTNSSFEGLEKSAIKSVAFA